LLLSVICEIYRKVCANFEIMFSSTGFSIKAVPFKNAILNVKELGGNANK